MNVTDITACGAARATNRIHPAGLALPVQRSLNHALVAQLVGAELEKAATAIFAERRERHLVFGQHLFADPAWDILLVLTIAECRQHRVTVSQLCEKVGVPMTTGLRWIANMTDEGLLVRRDDMFDKRRKFIGLTSDALTKMVQFFSATEKPRAHAA